SGTTLFMQWLASTNAVAYPSNLLSRFYGAPVIGAMVQLLLTDPRYNFRNEITDFNSAVSFESENGKTSGALAPNEFWYFWRRFLPFKDLDWLPDEELFKIVDRETLIAELRGLTQVFAKPFALKSMILNYNIGFLDAIFDKALFVQLQREPVANVASVLAARKRQLGSEAGWYSFKIPEYPKLKDLEPIRQCAGQVHYINRAVTRGIASLKDSRKIVVSYEAFCRDPRRVFDELVEKLGISRRVPGYSGPQQFMPSRESDLPDRAGIENALAEFEKQDS
ncbi:MAG TPA: sulfotransferase, partial [Terriglobia bacterium]|nr:sulfotransferase [Terriglobia bacterium]